MLKDLLAKFDKKAFIEAVKLGLRLFTFIIIGFVLDFLVWYFAGVNSEIGKTISAILILLDKYLHEIRTESSKKALKGWSRGLLPY